MELVSFVGVLCAVILPSAVTAGPGTSETLTVTWYSPDDAKFVDTLEVMSGGTTTIEIEVHKAKATTQDLNGINATLTVQEVDASAEVMSGLALTPIDQFQGTDKTHVVTMLLDSGSPAYVSLLVDSISSPVIKSHTVQLVLNLDLDPVPDIPALNIVIRDGRTLKVGFTNKHCVSGGEVYLSVAAHDFTVKLAQDLKLEVSDVHGNYEAQTVTIPAGSTEAQQVVFSGVNASDTSNFTARLKLVDQTLNKPVCIDQDTVSVTSHCNKRVDELADKVTGMEIQFHKLEEKYWQLLDMIGVNKTKSFREDVGERLYALEHPEDGEGAADLSGSGADLEGSGSAAGPNGAGPNGAGPNGAGPNGAGNSAKGTTSATNAPTTQTISATSTISATPTTSPTPATSPTPPPLAPLAVPTTTANITATDSSGGNDFMWWIFVGFVVVLVLAVAGYLIFNNRAKVKVYVVGLWKSMESDGSSGTKTSSKRSSNRKYTSLPTSVHDSLTHED